MHETGTGATKDLARAVHFYTRGCDGGAGNACYNLGGMFAQGRGVAKNVFQALPLFRKACDMGEQPACESVKRLTGKP
jgi:TPR repeat protein